MRLLACLSFGLLAACAGQPPAPTAPAAPAAAATAPAAAAATGVSGTTAAAPGSTTQTQINDVIRRAVKTGYKAHTDKDGVKTYCREETPLGTRFANYVCYTPEQLAQQFQLQDLNRDQMEQGSRCGSSICSPSK